MRVVAAQGLHDLLPSGHGRISPGAPIVGIVFGLTFTVLLAIGLYLIARIRQYDHVYLASSESRLFSFR
ncbi:hypothetical protein BDZ94DRAFT_1259706 [Collybia nuda]|uniref:Uncharacterized protein n=1 Tax=Collybia nuda TaxID=64659 RepID=A0A9P5Y427_9AGAR|nr:hypothetical protein BDZ94DRAFT_1259706 [Collybia nuda]